MVTEEERGKLGLYATDTTRGLQMMGIYTSRKCQEEVSGGSIMRKTRRSTTQHHTIPWYMLSIDTQPSYI
jgi:hypothetical protein